MLNPILFRKTLRDLWSRKGALAALVTIVGVGVASFIALAAVHRDLDGSRSRYYRNYRLADFRVDLKRAPASAIARIGKIPNVRAVRGRVQTEARIDLPDRPEPISGAAISLPTRRRPVINDILLRTGTWFSGTNREEVILNEAFARANGLKPGDRIRVQLPDKSHDLLVVGSAMSPEFVYLIPPGAGGIAPDPERFGVLYLQEDFLQESCNLKSAYNQAIGLAHDDSRNQLETLLNRIEREFDAYGVANTTPKQEQRSVRFLQDELKGLKVSARIMPLIFLVVAALILNVLSARMVAQQRPIIGTLRALGYTRGDIMRHFMEFGAVVGVTGGILGMFLGSALQGYFVVMYRQFFALPSIEKHFYPDIYIAGFAISIVFALLGILRGVWQGARLEPAEAMRPPPPEKAGRVPLEWIPSLWRKLPFHWKMSIRAIFRNPFRSSVTILAALISTAIILSSLSTMDSLDYLMHYEFREISHQDVTIALRDPVERASVQEVESLPYLAYAEPQLGVVCDLSNGLHRKRIGVTGLPPDNRLYTPLDESGNPIRIPKSGLILTRKLAEILHAEVGDIVRLRPLIGERREVRAPVAGITRTFLGMSAYADIGYLSRLLGESWAANVVLGRYIPVSNRPAERDDTVSATEARDWRFLSALKRRPRVVGVGERKRALDQMEQVFGETLGTSISALVFFAALIAFGTVLNAALVSLSERRREVGTLRVLGYGWPRVARIFGGEILLLNGIGVVMGLFAGVGLAHTTAMAYNTELYRFPAIVYPSRMIQTVLLMALFVGAAYWIIRRMIRKLDWLSVLNARE